jgi:two-component system phosphate regulon sensor histidine kinase PhoR
VTTDTAADDGAVHALEHLDLARRRFINVVGHELRTPITTLRGLAEQLDASSAEEIKDTIAPALLRNARRVEALLDQILLASDITTALPTGDPEEIDLIATAQAIWDGSNTEAGLAHVGDRDAVVLINPEVAERILEQVLDNAILYGQPPFVLRTGHPEGSVELTCESGGAVVSADDLALAFELFYRGEGAVTAAPGFGLGLPVARALARQSGGDVRIAAQPDGGLAVSVELPTT